MAKLDSVRRGLLILPRPDLTTALVDVIEWRLRAHDGTRLWGLRGISPFHPSPKGAAIREVSAIELPEISLDLVSEGVADFVFQVPAGRRLEDRVLDVLRVLQFALDTAGVDAGHVSFVAGGEAPEPDEFMIADRLRQQGICSLP